MRNLIWYLLGIGLLVAVLFSMDTYRKYFKANINLPPHKVGHLYIPTGSKAEDVYGILLRENLIIDRKTFEWLANRKDFKDHIHPGHYVVSKGMSNNEIIRMLMAGRQMPVKVTFNNLRTRDQLAEKISTEIEATKADILHLLSDEQFLSQYGFSCDNVMVVFIPNTYQIYWNSSAEQFFLRMYKEYTKFWTDERKKKAEAAGLTPIQVSILASIVDEETEKKSEEPAIAGVYINRLDKHMLLQADPTVRYALGDFTIKRILKKHLEIQSPYNTYIHPGLPPGPINIPSIESIEAVLNFEKSGYLYFCAKEDFSGYHHFSKTMEQHLAYARLYQKALTQHRIMK